MSAYGDAEALLPQHGESLRPLIETDEAKRDFALNEWELLPTRAGVALSLRTIRTKTHKLTVDLQSGAGEMYDMAGDPGEKVNLFDNPKHAEIQAELMAGINSRADDMLPIQEQVGMA